MPTNRREERTHKSPWSLTVKELLTEGPRELGLRLIAGKKGLGRLIECPRPWRFSPRALGAKDVDARGGVALLGKGELQALDTLSPQRRKTTLERVEAARLAAIVLVGKLRPPRYLLLTVRSDRLPLLSTPLDASRATRRLGSFIRRRMGAPRVVHGVLMDIYGLGILIVGESGIGKSESALELIERGHRLVSDDVIEVSRTHARTTNTLITGRSPRLTRHYMELRGLGIVNVRDLFGPSSIRASKSIDLVIRLERWEERTEIERLGLEQETFPMFGVRLPLIRMPVGPGRNLAMLIEVAARNHLLKRAGRHAAHRLLKRLSVASRRTRRPK